MSVQYSVCELSSTAENAAQNFSNLLELIRVRDYPRELQDEMPRNVTTMCGASNSCRKRLI